MQNVSETDKLHFSQKVMETESELNVLLILNVALSGGQEQS